MSPRPRRNDLVACSGCGTPNDPDRGGTNCIWCSDQLPAPWGGDYIRNNPPEGGNS